MFDIPISKKDGMIFAMCLRRKMATAGVDNGATETAKMAINKTYMQAHDTLGHAGKESTKLTAKTLGWEVTRQVQLREGQTKVLVTDHEELAVDGW